MSDYCVGYVPYPNHYDDKGRQIVGQNRVGCVGLTLMSATQSPRKPGVLPQDIHERELQGSGPLTLTTNPSRHQSPDIPHPSLSA
eukprot:4418459-Pyramimonas_sp.AAC.1